MVGAEAQNSFIGPGSSGPEHPVCNISVCVWGGGGVVQWVVIENVFWYIFFTEKEPRPMSMSLKK